MKNECLARKHLQKKRTKENLFLCCSRYITSQTWWLVALDYQVLIWRPVWHWKRGSESGGVVTPGPGEKNREDWMCRHLCARPPFKENRKQVH
jgi:hypothetical protein